jgi:hypothetical protein
MAIKVEVFIRSVSKSNTNTQMHDLFAMVTGVYQGHVAKSPLSSFQGLADVKYAFSTATQHQSN